MLCHSKQYTQFFFSLDPLSTFAMMDNWLSTSVGPENLHGCYIYFHHVESSNYLLCHTERSGVLENHINRYLGDFEVLIYALS